VKGYGIPLGRVLFPASRPDSPLLAPRWTSSITSAAARQRPGPPRCRYDSAKTCEKLAARAMTGQIAHRRDHHRP
jgi:hypothetical protein